jgi:hypothetical protein
MFSIFDSILSGLTHILIEIFSDLPWMWASVKFSWNSSPHSLRKTLSPQIQNPRRWKTIVIVFKLIIQNKHLTTWIVQLGVIPWSHVDSKQTITIMIEIIISSHISEHVCLTFFVIVSGTVLSALICITRSHHPQNLSKQPTIHQGLQNTPYWQKNNCHIGSITLYLRFCLISVHFLIFVFQKLFYSLRLCTTNTLYACFWYIVHQSTPVYINKGKSDHAKYLSCIQNRKTPKNKKGTYFNRHNRGDVKHTALRARWLPIPNRVRGHLPRNFQSSYEYLIYYQNCNSWAH